MRLVPTDLPEVLVLEPKVFEDERGFFMESFHARRFAELGLPAEFVQDNHSRSRKGALRGLHYQLHQPQGKLIRVVRGEVLDVAVDIRRGLPRFGKWVAATLSEGNKRMMYVPPGFAHGFCTSSDSADVLYKCTDFYAPGDEHGIRWDDADIAIAWPDLEFILSPKDQALPLLRDAGQSLPRYEPDPQRRI